MGQPKKGVSDGLVKCAVEESATEKATATYAMQLKSNYNYVNFGVGRESK